MKRLIKILTFLLLLPFTSAILAQEEVTINSNNINLSGTLLNPKNTKTVVLLISGSGNTDRNGNSLVGTTLLENNSLKMVAEALFEKNIASLRYDKRGIGKSNTTSIKEETLTFDMFVNDAIAWVHFLSERYSKIIIAGHSQGGLVAILAAQKTNVTKIITLAGLGDSAYNTLKTQLQNQPKFVTDTALPILDKIKAGQKVDSIPPYLMSVFRPQIQNYLQSFLSYDPKSEIEKLSIPALIVQGTTDIQISVENAKTLAEGNEKAELLIIEGMNHVLKDAESDRTKNLKTYSNPDLPLHPSLMPPIIAFIEKAS
ncbi:alpha/beta hydrolase [Aquimarina brevivitae]|uniref:Serine aminopeptidase S33 domain-containing protein n=1 Tax=Aquimarina brevivitae TaxID=323412 RepID=A0A4Q7PIP7_9FLAO|nr:alpha/beta hydrolase [Aquimarina brevivitae]RZT00306.1 hypothetical protein EV197_1542 [Aquimarina brevivitae]